MDGTFRPTSILWKYGCPGLQKYHHIDSARNRSIRRARRCQAESTSATASQHESWFISTAIRYIFLQCLQVLSIVLLYADTITNIV